ncbi:MAG: ankyrin repeat domain-containing protein [Lentisphaerae bacterium]|nr:ankyrin repeat domain-containing protein [Lentisphaerota bacterium]
MDLLLSRGASPDGSHGFQGWVYSDDYLPVKGAVDSGKVEILRKLLDAGLNLDMDVDFGDCDTIGQLAVWRAIERAQDGNNCLAESTSKMVSLILEKCRDPRQAVRPPGTIEDAAHTPLGWAAARGDANLVRLLLRCGANPGFRGEDCSGEPKTTGPAAVDLARENGHDEVVQLLVEAVRANGGEPNVGVGENDVHVGPAGGQLRRNAGETEWQTPLNVRKFFPGVADFSIYAAEAVLTRVADLLGKRLVGFAVSRYQDRALGIKVNPNFVAIEQVFTGKRKKGVKVSLCRRPDSYTRHIRLLNLRDGLHGYTRVAVCNKQELEELLQLLPVAWTEWAANHPLPGIPVGQPADGEQEAVAGPLREVSQEEIDGFLDELRLRGGTAGNTTLRRALGWDDLTYRRVKAALVQRGTIRLGRGRGGSVRLTEARG